MRPIEEVLPGQRVWGYDFAAGCWRLAEVAIQHSRDHVGQMVEMRVGETVLSVTPGHPFWVESGEGLAERPWPGHLKEREDEGMALAGRWVNAADVREGDTLVLRSGERGLVSGHRLYAAELRVYNLTVLEVHTYAVGGRGVLVHNGSGLTDRQRSTIDRSSELTITTGAAANRLDRALGGAPRDKFFAHHIIPWDLRTHPVVKAAAKAGFNINGKLNGILLGYAPHKYGHKAYDTALASLADELLKLKLTDTQYAHVLQKLADQIGRRLSRNSVTRNWATIN